MFQTKIILSLSLLAIIGNAPQLYALTTENHVATVQWEEASYPVRNLKAKAIVNDPDMNKYPQSIDRINVHIFSDSDPNGITVRATETSVNSGIFETIVIITNDPSKENRIHTADGDTITVRYADTTIPKDQPSKELEISGTAFAGSTGPPLERAPASDIRVYNTKGNSVDEISLGQQVEITANVKNQEERLQKFAYLVAIQNQRGETVSLGWINGTLEPLQTLIPAISWVPNIPGLYTGTVFVWESVENPTALSPPISIDLRVAPKQFDIEEFSKEEFAKLTLTDYKYSYDSKKQIDFGVRLEGYYPTYYPPHVMIKSDVGKTVWDNQDFIEQVPVEKITPTSFDKQYNINEIGGPIKLEAGKYTLFVKFEKWQMQRDLFVK